MLPEMHRMFIAIKFLSVTPRAGHSKTHAMEDANSLPPYMAAVDETPRERPGPKPLKNHKRMINLI